MYYLLIKEEAAKRTSIR